MNTVMHPITATTVLSLGLHAALLMVAIQTQAVRQATGKGISIELVSSSYISNQRETEQAARKTTASPQPKYAEETVQSKQIVATTGKPVMRPAPEPVAQVGVTASTLNSIDDGVGKKVLARSTNAAMHDISIVDLLHTEISEHKQYPYMARRQHREGVARVGFVLHPDGSIDETRLVHSSRTRTLDKAALEAVQRIEPFEAAKDYLDQPEAFQVDVVFNVM